MMKSIRHILSAAALSGLCALAGITCLSSAQAQPQKTTADSAALQKDLENTYQQLQAALKDKDYDAFMAVCETSAEMPLTKAQWPEAAEGLTMMLPKISKMRFVQLTPDNDWAGYFFQEMDNDPHYISVSLHRFHRVGQKWKFTLSTDGMSFPKGKNAAENNAGIQKWIASIKDIKPSKR